MKKQLFLLLITFTTSIYCSKQEQPISSYPLTEGIFTRLYSQCPSIIEHVNAPRHQVTPYHPYIEAFENHTDRFCKEHLDEVTFFNSNGEKITTLEWISKAGTTFSQAKKDSKSWRKWEWTQCEGYPIKVHLERNDAIVYEKALSPKHGVVAEFIKQCFTGEASPIEKKIAIIVGTHNCDDQNIKEALEKYFKEK